MMADAINVLSTSTAVAPQYEHSESLFKIALVVMLPTFMDAFYDYFAVPMKGKVFLHCATAACFSLDADTTLEKVSAITASMQCFRSIKEFWMQENVKPDLLPLVE